MLVLSRKLNQEIQIGDNVIVRVVAISNDKVRLGIVADRSVAVLRGELLPGAKKYRDLDERENDG